MSLRSILALEFGYLHRIRCWTLSLRVPQCPFGCFPGCRRYAPSGSFRDPQVVLIPDKYPKAKFHALVVARDPRLQGPLDLQAEDAPLVEHMLVRDPFLLSLSFPFFLTLQHGGP